MKKLLTILLALTLVFALSACWGGNSDTNPTDAPTEAPTEAPTDKPTEEPAKPQCTHEEAEDGGDCTTAVICTCGAEVVAAKTHADEDGNQVCDNADCNYFFRTPISTEEEFQQALQQGGKYVLTGNLTVENAEASWDNIFDLSLDGYTLSVQSALFVSSETTVYLRNGTIINLQEECDDAVFTYGTVYIADCTLISDNYYALYICDGKVVVERSDLQGGVTVCNSYTEAAELIATNQVTVTGECGIDVEDASIATFGFDPTPLLGIYNEGAVVDNGDGTWSLIGPDHPSAPSEPTDKPTEEPSEPTDKPTEEPSDEPGDAVEGIYTAEDLEAAFLVGGSYKLMNDLDMGDAFIGTGDAVEISLDLGGHTLTLNAYSIEVWYDSTLNLTNGTIKQTRDYTEAINCRGAIMVSDCTLIGNKYYAIYIIDGTVTAENTVLTGGVSVAIAYEDSASVIATNNVTVTAYEDESVSGVSVSRGGVATFSFDPTPLLDVYNEGAVVDNGDGTWTVA